MRIIFAGTPEIGVPSLLEISRDFEVCGVLTNPDRQKGRKKVLQACPIKTAALELNIEVFQPEKLNSEFYDQIKALNPDLLVCIAFGKIFRKEFLDIFPLGGVNIHPSLLPVYRGPSPLSASIMNGDRSSGISIQRLAAKMDSGNILLQEKFILDKGETTGSLTERVAFMAAPLINRIVHQLEDGIVKEWVQDDSAATFCKLLNKDDGIIDWNNSSDHILNSIRAYSPWPLAQTMFGDKILNIIEAKESDIQGDGDPGKVLSYTKKDGYLVKTGDGTIYVTCLQLQSKKVLDYKSFNNGVQNFVDTLLG